MNFLKYGDHNYEFSNGDQMLVFWNRKMKVIDFLKQNNQMS